jgi:hypothetical protein
VRANASSSSRGSFKNDQIDSCERSGGIVMEPRRIIDGDVDPSRRRLLGSAVLDEPPAGGKERLLVAFGLGGGVALKAGAATAASAAATTSAASVIIVKWFLVGALLGTVATGGLTLTQGVLAKRPDASRIAPPVVEENGRDVGAAAEQRALVPSADVVTPPLPAQGEPRAQSPLPAPRTEAAPRAPAPTSPSLAAEIASLSAVQRTLSTGDAASALRELDAHTRAFPSPVLGPETLLVRVEALVSLGRGAEAKQLGAAFLTSNPTSAHAQRIRSLLNRSDLGAP